MCFLCLATTAKADLHALDYIVIFGYLVVSLGLGFALRRHTTREEFFTAGRSMGKLTVGLSVMATLFSANSFVMYPSTAYENSLRIVMAVVAFWAMGPLVIWVFIPVYAKLNCSTAYEYLERRFHVSVRCLASSLFILLRIAWMAAATFAASVAIAGIWGIEQYRYVAIGLGAVAIAYTMLGGLRAVMWTDVLQFFVFFGTILFAAALLLSKSDGGATAIVDTYFKDRDNLIFDLSLEPALRFGTIAVFVGSFLEALSAFGAEQVAVQRYLAARDARTSQTGFVITLLGLAVVIPGLLIIGMGLFSFFHHHPDDLSPLVISQLEAGDTEAAQKLRDEYVVQFDGLKTEALANRVQQHYRENPKQLHADVVKLKLHDQAMPQFVRFNFPPGVVGLLVAALMAATMSSIDSGIHSVTTALIVDFRDRLFPRWRPSTDTQEMVIARVAVLLVGVLAITLACFVGELGDVFAVAKKTVGAFAAPLLAVFVLGLFVKRATTAGVFFGTWMGAAFTLWFMYQYDNWFSMWFFPIGFFASVGLSLLISCLPLHNTHTESGNDLTYWSLAKSDNVKHQP